MNTLMSTLTPQRVEDTMMQINRNFMVQTSMRRWLQMMEEGLIKTKDVIRVEVNDDGTVNLLDFTLPTKSGMKRTNVPQEDVESWIMESISMLRITESNDLIPELGFKISDQLYYILNREGEME
jgi:hypothetical protein